jgi:hypothetical protein
MSTVDQVSLTGRVALVTGSLDITGGRFMR